MKKRKAKIIPAIVTVLVLALVGYFGFVSAMKTLYPIEYDEFVEASGTQYNLEKNFVYAVIKCESNFQNDAVSYAGAIGLMQMLPDTFEWLQTKTGDSLEADSLNDPETSIKYGCYLYSILLRQFGTVPEAVAAYHAGSGNVERWLKNKQYSDDGKTLKEIPFKSTKAYVEKIIKTQKIYDKLYNK